ncbi:MAG: adenosylcobinamide-phosphate synthase CbiB [Burkholderiales bacterium]
MLSMTAALTALFAVLLDRWLKEPPRWHPLVGFGGLASRVEGRLYGGAGASAKAQRWRGAAAVAVLLGGIAVPAWAVLHALGAYAWPVEAVLLYLALGAASLEQHAGEVRAALAEGDLARARERVGRIVSRDTAALDETAVAGAAVESVLENGCDAVFGALFWFFLAGAPGAVLYRLANTLDAMWGYKNERYRYFGWAAARLDDGLNWLPARLTALSYALLGNAVSAWRCWRAQARAWESPNAGPVMAAGAGALRVQLGGPAIYHGRVEARPILGEGRAAGAEDIARAVALVRRSLWLWLAVALAGGLFHA